MKKSIALLLTVLFLLGTLVGCGSAPQAQEDVETVSFTDSTGRSVTVPKEITRIAPSGAVATMFLAVAAPEYMVCISSTPSSSQYPYLAKNLITLPTTGQLYGSKSTINLESLMSAQPQVIIDFGDPKDGIREDMAALQKQTGIPTIFIESDLDSMEEAFRMFGTLVPSKAERCEELANYVHETLSLAQEASSKIPESERKRVMFTSGVSGLNTDAKGSTQAQVIEVIGAENAIVVDDVSNRGGGNTINMEQLFNFNPDVIVFSAGSMYSGAASDAAWSQLSAIQSGAYYEVPTLPYNWMANPPSLNMLLGIRWLGNLIYPEYYDVDMVAETQRVYKLFWDYDLTEEAAREMLSKSTLK